MLTQTKFWASIQVCLHTGLSIGQPLRMWPERKVGGWGGTGLHRVARSSAKASADIVWALRSGSLECCRCSQQPLAPLQGIGSTPLGSARASPFTQDPGAPFPHFLCPIPVFAPQVCKSITVELCGHVRVCFRAFHRLSLLLSVEDFIAQLHTVQVRGSEEYRLQCGVYLPHVRGPT